MNTTDLLLQMTLAATQIAQNTAPPVSDRTEAVSYTALTLPTT